MANATIKIQFGSDSAGGADTHLSADIDARPDGLNAGKTSFAPGDDVYILVYKSDNVVITGTDCSAGSLSASGAAVVTLTQELFFEASKTASLNVPASTAVLDGTTWMGRILGTITLGADKTTCTVASAGVAVANVSYRTNALVYKLSTPASINDSTDYSILVLITGDLA